jgi:hypothetical protein
MKTIQQRIAELQQKIKEVNQDLSDYEKRLSVHTDGVSSFVETIRATNKTEIPESLN